MTVLNIVIGKFTNKIRVKVTMLAFQKNFVIFNLELNGLEPLGY